MCTSLTRRGFSRKTSEKADLVCSCDVVCSALTRAGGLQMNVVFKGKGQISLPRSKVIEKRYSDILVLFCLCQRKTDYAAAVKVYGQIF